MNYVIRFFQEVRIEFSKVVWPRYNELVGSLVIVLLLVAAFSLFLGAVDYLFYLGAEYIFKL